jgi:hypothetical protein
MNMDPYPFRYDGRNPRRLIARSQYTHSLRGFFYEFSDEDGQDCGDVTVVQQYGRDADFRDQLVLTAYEWPGGRIVAHVVRPWKSGEYSKAWAEVRRQIRVTTGLDLGEKPYAEARAAA